MSRRIAAKITGVAAYAPPGVLTNADLEKMVETSDEWIRTRTGIRERRMAEPQRHAERSRKFRLRRYPNP